MAKSIVKDAEVFVPQTNGAISDSLLQNWTVQALECYNIKCDCAKCSIKKQYYSFVCQMPKVIKNLVENHIKPDLTLIQTNSF